MSTADPTGTPEYHALVVVLNATQDAWDKVRPACDLPLAQEPPGLSSEQQDRYDRYVEAIAELNGYRVRHGLGHL